MASIIEGYSYDIFISYRQKDNKGDRWVSEFVKELKTELDSTFKEEISVYFDINPHDGLLETHDVDASLKDKLKCLVFIPIISRTYCDPRSFAWEYEFKAFVKQTSKDQFGLKIKLTGGNVTNRVLPVQIHDLNLEDRKLVESELGGHLRGIEFIYKEPGVNRPLTTNDDETKNLNGTKYKNQINKVANTIHEIISALIGGSATNNMADLADSIPSISIPVSPKVKKIRWEIPKRKIIFGLTFVIITIAAVLFYQSSLGRIERKILGQKINISIILPDSNQLIFISGPLAVGRRALDIAPDGSSIVYTTKALNGTTHLCLRYLNDPKIIRLAGTEGAYAPFFAPDCKWIAFFANDKLKKISIESENVEILTTTTNALDGIWNKDNFIVWTSNEGATFNSITSDGLDYMTKISNVMLWGRPFQLSPNEFIVSNYYNEMHSFSFNLNDEKIIMKGVSNPYVFKNKILFVKGNDLLFRDFDKRRLDVTGSGTLIEKGISIEGYTNAQYSISENGIMVLANGTHALNGNLCWVSENGEIEKLPFENQIFGTFSLSPDGSKIAILVKNEATEIWIYPLDAPENKMRLLWDGNYDCPQFSPDGKWIYFNSYKNGSIMVMKKQIDGSKDAQDVISSDLKNSPMDFNSEGTLLYTTKEENSISVDLGFYQPQKKENLLTFHSKEEVNETLASFIKEDWLSFTSDQTGRFEVFITDLLNPDVRVQVTFDGGEEPRYCDANKTLYFRNGFKMMAVNLEFGQDRSIKLGQPYLVFENINWINVSWYSYEVSSNGKRFLLILRDRKESTNEIKIIQNFMQ